MIKNMNRMRMISKMETIYALKHLPAGVASTYAYKPVPKTQNTQDQLSKINSEFSCNKTER